MDIERLKAIERDTWNWIRAFGDQGAVTKEDFYALVTAIIANPDEAPDVSLPAMPTVTHEIDGSLYRHNNRIPAYEITSPFTSDKNPEPVTPPPDELVEALRDEGMLIVKHYADLAAAVRDMSWALEHSANDCDTAEELERYIPICKTAHAVEEMNQ